MNASTKVILGFVGGVVFACLAIVALLAAGFFYADKTMRAGIAKQENARAAGTAAGKTTDQAGCIEKTIDLEDPTDSFDYIYIADCLRESRPTPNFCNGVPPPLSGNNWEKEQCAIIGRDTPHCRSAYTGKKFFCEDLKKK